MLAVALLLHPRAGAANREFAAQTVTDDQPSHSPRPCDAALGWL